MSNIVEYEGFDRSKVELIKNTVAKGVTDDELKLFLMVAKKTGLDPFSKQVYCVKRGGTATIQAGIDGFRAVAARTGQHAGTDDAVYGEEIDGKYPKYATVTVYRAVNGEKCPFTATARWNEYKQEYNGKLSGMWEKMPYLMLAKCAEALALRKAFPNELSGVYTTEEMAQADNVKKPEPAAVPEEERVIDRTETVEAVFTIPAEGTVIPDPNPEDPFSGGAQQVWETCPLCKVQVKKLYGKEHVCWPCLQKMKKG